MKSRSIINIVFFSLTINTSIGQTIQKIDPTNCREGEEIEYCGEHKKKQSIIEKDPNAAFYFEQERNKQNEIIHNLSLIKSGTEKGTIYKIPIVFHVLHNDGAENISKEQILDALNILNRDYRKLNADANNVKSDFSGMPADIEIEFVLATKAPDGACFSGITRTKSALTTQGEDGTAQVDAIVAGNDVYQGNWPGNKYLNIYICEDIGGKAGYTYRPTDYFGAESMYAGIWILQDYVGSIGTSSTIHSRTLTHETGHWLNLIHPWGPNNSPGNPQSCEIDDDVTDTPITIGNTTCNLNSNTCDDLNPSQGITSSWNYNVVDNVENYMDYSYCNKMFTPGQKTRMRAALLSNIGGRSNICSSSNLSSVGADGNLTLCKADFVANKKTICAGEAIQFSDISYNTASSWNWTLQGATPASSTQQNPTVTYNTPGIYTVTLIASDGSSSDSESKTSYIKVLPASSNLPFFDGFESYSNFQNTTDWIVENNQNNQTFEIVTGTAATGQKSVKLANFNQTGTNTDILYAKPVDLSGITGNVTLSFKMAYRKTNTSGSEFLRIAASNDCGSTWNVRKSITGSSLSSIAANSSWTPTPSDWVTVHVTNITTSYFVNNFRYRFIFEGNGGNNLYLDDINLYEGNPSDLNIIASTENLTEIKEFSLFPNPTENELHLSFQSNEQQQIQFEITDIHGKIIQTNKINAEIGNNLIVFDTHDFTQGLYFIKYCNGKQSNTQQFVIK